MWGMLTQEAMTMMACQQAFKVPPTIDHSTMPIQNQPTNKVPLSASQLHGLRNWDNKACYEVDKNPYT